MLANELVQVVAHALHLMQLHGVGGGKILLVYAHRSIHRGENQVLAADNRTDILLQIAGEEGVRRAVILEIASTDNY